MYYYQIADVVLKSECKLPSFEAFSCGKTDADMELVKTDELPMPGTDTVSGSIVHRRQPEGWFFHSTGKSQTGVYIKDDYSRMKVLGESEDTIQGMNEWYVRIAVECMLAHRGYLSLHAAAVEVNGEAFAFSGPSGMGKSTRAYAWIEELGAQLINGDRPLIDVRHMELYGVPWDGKEQCFRNVHYPLKAVCDIRRSESVYIREMSFSQRRKLLMRQSFLPMWDTETASIQMANISRLAAEANMVRAFCGPAGEDARALYDGLQKKNHIKVEKDIKAKQGFLLRNIADKTLLIPTDDRIKKFEGAILLNEVSALVWRKLQNPISKDDLLKAVLNEFEVEKTVAAVDLDVLLQQFRTYGVIEDD